MPSGRSPGVRDLPGGGELVDRLAAAADAAGAAAQRLEDGVTGLDEFINSIGGPSSPTAARGQRERGRRAARRGP